MLLFNNGICKSKAEGYSLLIECIYNSFNKINITGTASETSSVPDCRRKSSINRSYFNALSEIFRTIFHHCRKNKIKSELSGKIRKMKFYFIPNFIPPFLYNHLCPYQEHIRLIQHAFSDILYTGLILHRYRFYCHKVHSFF